MCVLKTKKSFGSFLNGVKYVIINAVMKNYYFISSFEKDFKSLEILAPFLIEHHDATKGAVFIPSSLIKYPSANEFEQALIEKLGSMGISFKWVVRLDNVTSQRQAREYLQEASFVYIHGGNPLVLWEVLKYFGIRKLLKKISANIMGLSAGAMVMGEHIVLTPTSETYPNFVVQKAYGFGQLNIMPHINNEDIYWPIMPTGDGPIHMKDLQQLSKKVTIHALKDGQHISHIDNQYKINVFPLLLFRRNHAYLMDNQGIHLIYPFDKLDQQARKLEGFRESWITKPSQKLTTVTRYFRSFEEAFSLGYLRTLAHITVDQRHVYPCEFRLLGFYEPSLVILQSNHQSRMVFFILSPQLEVGTIMYHYDERFDLVVETFSFRSRFGKFADEYKIKGMML